MGQVSRKTEIGPIDGTPEKRMFWSIISDYDLKTGLCELIDNALDLWRQQTKPPPLTIDIMLDPNRQMISVQDNAGGVREAELRLLLAPGGSRNDPSAPIVGIFGVGSKRAGIALGERVEIRTRYSKERSFQIDITKDWLQSPDWELAAYEIPDIAAGTTRVDISELRRTFADDDVEEVRNALGEIYAWFIGRGCTITLNGKKIKRHSFDSWAYPPGFEPRAVKFDVSLAPDGTISVKMVGGLILDRNAEGENYGVYFYCNRRLIVKELRTREVGYFVTSEAGVPHFDASLCRVIVELEGPAVLMPWNSSKTAINFAHPAFQHIRQTLIQLTSYYSSLSRRLKDDWERSVLRHTEGEVEEADEPERNVTSKNPLVLPPLPRVNKPRVEKLKALNKTQIRAFPDKVDHILSWPGMQRIPIG
jgi:hypothetical protein